MKPTRLTIAEDVLSFKESTTRLRAFQNWHDAFGAYGGLEKVAETAEKLS